MLLNGFSGVFDIVVDKKHRNNGYGKQIMLNILKLSKINGAENAYLQVMIDNVPALNLYSRLEKEK